MVPINGEARPPNRGPTKLTKLPLSSITCFFVSPSTQQPILYGTPAGVFLPVRIDGSFLQIPSTLQKISQVKLI